MKNIFEKVLDLRATSDFEKAKSTVSEGVSLRGYNLWILLCAALLASLGLDTNSTAVIIGAMLISPLMSPILGVGISVATHEKALLVRSLKNLGLAVGISLFASTVYFVLTPLGEVTPELQARTFPTLLDVLVALFGGIAGIVSISRRDQTNAIPGVAIATALMPPLCTAAGFGIATRHWSYFLGAFYLFFINAVFISLTTYLIAKYLHFPTKEFINKGLERKYSRWFTAISIIVLLPSIYFLYTVYKSELIKKDINNLVISAVQKHGNEILKWDLDNRDSIIWIKVYHSGTPLSDSFQTAIDSSLASHKMKLYKLKPMRVNLTKEEVSQLSAEMTRQMFQEMHLEEIIQEKSKEAEKDTIPVTQLYKEVRIAFPFVDTISTASLIVADTSSSKKMLPVIFYRAKRIPGASTQRQLYSYLKVRLSKDTLVLIRK